MDIANWTTRLTEGDSARATPPAENADTWIPHLVKRLNEGTGAQVRVCIDAGFTDNDTLEALEERNIEYLGRLRRRHHSFKNRATAATDDDNGCFNGVIDS